MARIVAAIVFPTSGGRKIARLGTRSGAGAARWRFQISGSGTLRRIQATKSAGTTPTTKSHRQPKCRQHDAAERRGEDVPDRPARLHEPDRLAAMLRRPGLGDEQRARGPLAAHPDPDEGAPDDELRERLRRRRSAAVNTE